MNRKLNGRARRKNRVRKKITGTSEKPRMSVFRSLNHISAQLIDDSQGKTVAQASTHEKDFSASGHKGNRASAKRVGEMIAERAKAKKVETIVFDRNGYLYHGSIKELADAARQKGLKF